MYKAVAYSLSTIYPAVTLLSLLYMSPLIYCVYFVKKDLIVKINVLSSLQPPVSETLSRLLDNQSNQHLAIQTFHKNPLFEQGLFMIMNILQRNKLGEPQVAERNNHA